MQSTPIASCTQRPANALTAAEEFRIGAGSTENANFDMGSAGRLSCVSPSDRPQRVIPGPRSGTRNLGGRRGGSSLAGFLIALRGSGITVYVGNWGAE